MAMGWKFEKLKFRVLLGNFESMEVISFYIFVRHEPLI